MRNGGFGRLRAQSSVLGVALLVAITVIGVTSVVTIGSVAFDDADSQMRAGGAEQAMAQFDAKASLVAHGSADRVRTRLPSGSDASVRTLPDTGWMNITVENETTGDVESTLLNATLGAVVYEHRETSIAYQGGGVWRRSGDHSVMVSPPEFHHRGRTLTIPVVVVVDGEPSLDSRAAIEQQGPSRAVYPDASANRRNPVTDGQVVVTVGSDYYRAWGSFFEERTGGTISYDHDAKTVSVVLVTPAQAEPVAAAVAATAASKTLSLQGSGSFPAFTDSYNSTQGAYTVSQSSNGTIQTAGDVSVGGNGRVDGVIESGGTVSLQGTAEVSGTVGWTSGFSASGSATYPDDEQIDGVTSATSIDTEVRKRVDALASENDNAGTDAIADDQLNYTNTNTRTLTAGKYYLSDLSMSGQDLTLDTSGGRVTIGVEGDVHLDDAANITVVGGGSARIYMKGDATITKGSTVHVDGDNSRRFWLYGTDNSDVDLSASQGAPVRFVGVIYTPSSGGDATVLVKHAAVYGGIVSGGVDIGTGGEAHFDQSLRSTDPLPSAGTAPELTFLHISQTNVTVSS